MITPSFSLRATEQVLPKLSLDFTTANLDARVTFTRSGATATRINSSGFVEVVAANTPRFDFDPVSRACKGLLIEESRQNTTTYSEDFSNAAWTKGDCSVDSGLNTSPANSATAYKLIENSANAAHRLQKQSSLTSGSPQTLSIFVKAAGRTWIAFNVANEANSTVWFDLANGVKGTQQSAVTDATITSFGNGWYRVTSTVAPTGASRYFDLLLATGNGNYSYTGDGTSGIYIWGAQVESGAFPTSYIPNLGASGTTRNADVATMSEANFSSWWQPARGSVLARVRQSTISGTRPWVQFDDGTADNLIALRGNATNPELYIKATTDQAQIDAGTIAANTSYRLATAWETNNCAASIDSGVPVLDGAATIPVVSQARLGSDGTNYLNGWLESIEYYDTRPTNADLQVLSSAAGYRSMIRSMINPVL